MQPSTCASCENDAFAFYVQSYADLFSLQTILYLKRREQMLIIKSKLILVSLEKFSKDNTPEKIPVSDNQLSIMGGFSMAR